MNCCRKTMKIGVPARHRERLGEAGRPPGNRRIGPEAYLSGTSQGELVLSLPKEHPRTPGMTAISVVAATPGREFMEYPG